MVLNLCVLTNEDGGRAQEPGKVDLFKDGEITGAKLVTDSQ